MHQSFQLPANLYLLLFWLSLNFRNFVCCWWGTHFIEMSHSLSGSFELRLRTATQMFILTLIWGLRLLLKHFHTFRLWLVQKSSLLLYRHLSRQLVWLGVKYRRFSGAWRIFLFNFIVTSSYWSLRFLNFRWI